MADRLTAKQQARLIWLEALPPKIERLNRTVEQLEALRIDETLVRNTGRLLGELKSQASILGVVTLGEGFGYMEMLLRRGGGHQLKVRGLRELLAGIKTNLEGEIRAASTPESDGDDPEERDSVS